jgi:hypothetical protein
MRDLLIEIDERFGHFLHGLFHSHRGTGIKTSRPSSIDLNTQSRYEEGGYQMIGAVFTDDGFVRFFSHQLPFEIHVYGKGVERHGDTIFRLTEIGAMSDTKDSANPCSGG